MTPEKLISKLQQVMRLIGLYQWTERRLLKKYRR